MPQRDEQTGTPAEDSGVPADGFPLLGDRFPEMEVKTTHGKMKLPEAFAGRWFVLFSHPGDFTPVCTTEFVGFSKRYEQFRELHCELIGHSVDQVFSHIKWIEWIEENLDVEVPFPVIGDDMGQVARRLGMIHPGKGTNSVRAVFIVDPDGILRLVLYYPQEIGRNLDEILRAVKALQTHEKNNVALPANWPENDFLGDKVIIPPPETREEATQRLIKYEGYDWWFCYKDL